MLLPESLGRLPEAFGKLPEPFGKPPEPSGCLPEWLGCLPEQQILEVEWLGNPSTWNLTTVSAVANLSNPAANGATSSGALNAAGLAAISKTGTTQLKIYFTLDDNDDGGSDYVGFWGGEAATAANRPKLTVTYQP